ncbi:MAG TPA: guanylate kinase [Coxiellaceae bacterium]|nr:guanylate kinase [Coxiellaceae bacterium]
MNATANLFVIAAPSGAGKTSLIHAVVKDMDRIQVSVSHTTRLPRPDDVEGQDYFFVPETRFKEMVKQGEFLEYAEVFGKYYGTTKQWVEETLAQGIDILFELDWQGARSIKHLYPRAITVFILPPSVKALKERLIRRAQDRHEIIDHRMAGARETISHYDEFDYLLVNENFDHSIRMLEDIVLAARQRTLVQATLHADLIHNLLA